MKFIRMILIWLMFLRRVEWIFRLQHPFAIANHLHRIVLTRETQSSATGSARHYKSWCFLWNETENAEQQVVDTNQATWYMIFRRELKFKSDVSTPGDKQKCTLLRSSGRRYPPSPFPPIRIRLTFAEFSLKSKEIVNRFFTCGFLSSRYKIKNKNIRATSFLLWNT